MSNKLLPLTETTFFILFSLASEPKHGYLIIKEVEELSEGRIKMATGTLYGAIKRLIECDWIERIEPRKADPDGRDRKYYRLTDLGSKLFLTEAQRIRKLAVLVNSVQHEGGI
jgi:DNA-binding PadR family transcriptional regulator